MRLAYVSPMPPQRTGIAHYSAALLPYLAAEFAELDLYSDVAGSSPPWVLAGSLDSLVDRWSDYTFCLYHIGNSKAFHTSIYRMALEYPGVVVLHDFFLHHFIADLTLGEGDLPGYLREMAYAEGANGIERAYRAAEDWHTLPLFEIPLNDRLLDVSLGVMVHSRYALNQALERRPHLRTAYVPAPYGPETPDSLTRGELGLPEEAFIVTVAGMPNVAKRADLVMRAVAAVAQEMPHLRCLLVGDLSAEPSLPDDPISQETVLSTGYVPSLSRFLAFLDASDLIVNLRFPTVGEASALTLRALALGKPVIVSDAGWYAELPNGSCLKLTHTGDSEADSRALAGHIRNLVCDPEARASLGAAGQAYVKRAHDSRTVARAYRTTLDVWGAEIYG